MIRRLLPPLLLVGAVAGCAQAAPTTAAAPTAAAQPAAPAAAGQVAPGTSARVLRVSFANGRVTGDTGTVPVALGERVRLEITSDTAEEAHLHGYDCEVRVPAGGTASIDLTADIPGEFELELHHSGAPLATLRVS
ncbi:hypothetical protein [Pseudonocardia xishanensis]|uniref:EfeO-type cupredoxin-like domain-containing protein n=1 Tax=Pseudonocardia xishanensis TaxID=630995 RepID=A0ABP8RSQ2_9PSEU